MYCSSRELSLNLQANVRTKPVCYNQMINGQKVLGSDAQLLCY
jgi:hypothetical protein